MECAGGFFRKGISGGERKRVSIGHELLINPSVLLLGGSLFFAPPSNPSSNTLETTHPDTPLFRMHRTLPVLSQGAVFQLLPSSGSSANTLYCGCMQRMRGCGGVGALSCLEPPRSTTARLVPPMTGGALVPCGARSPEVFLYRSWGMLTHVSLFGFVRRVVTRKGGHTELPCGMFCRL